LQTHCAVLWEIERAPHLFGPVHYAAGARVLGWHEAGASLHNYTQVYGFRLN
jgi:hypothetical protein